MVGHHEDAIAGDADAAVRACRRSRPSCAAACSARSAGRVPASSAIALVGRGHVHDAVDDDRRDLQAAGVGNREHPLAARAARRWSCRSASASCSGCRRSRRCRSASRVSDVTRAKPIAGAPQQVHALVVGPQLQVVEALAEHLPVERAAVGRLHRHPHERLWLRRGARIVRRNFTSVAISGSSTMFGGMPLAGTPSRISFGELLVVERRQTLARSAAPSRRRCRRRHGTARSGIQRICWPCSTGCAAAGADTSATTRHRKRDTHAGCRCA